MNFDWIFWRAAVPILGPFILFFAYFLLQSATRVGGISFLEAISLGFEPSRLIFFSFSSYAYSYFTLEALALDSTPWQNSLSLFLLFVCVFVHYDIVLQKRDPNAVLPEKTTRIGILLAITASVISYMTQDAFL